MRLHELDANATAETLAEIAIAAGRVLRRMECAFIEKRIKADGSPTTMADLEAEKLILQSLRDIWSDIPVVAEETASTVQAGPDFFLVDPLDGTGDFIHGSGEYSVNIALIRNGRPVASVVAAPALGRIWIAGDTARTAEIPAQSHAPALEWRPVAVRRPPEDGLVALVSRRHGDEATEHCLSALSIRGRRMTSSALKFCLIASGEADIYVRCGPTMEWDTAAGDHILSRAGGCLVGPDHQSLTYGHFDRGYLNGPFAALGDPGMAARLSLPPGCPTPQIP